MSTSPPSSAQPLVRLGGTPPMRHYLTALWRRRQFAWNTATGELRAQHMDTALGNLWHLLNPILLISVYYLVFGVILGTDRGVDNFLAFLAIGVFSFHFSQKSIVGGASTIVNNQGLIRSLQFPRALLPVATVIREMLAYVSAAVVMFAVVIITEVIVEGAPVTPAWLLVLPVFVLQVVFNLGFALVGARLADRFRDLLNLLPFLFRIAFYLSGVLYLFTSYVETEAVLRLLPLNPFFVYLTLPREYLLASQDHAFIPQLWIAAVAWALVSVTFGLWYFRRGEKDYGRG